MCMTDKIRDIGVRGHGAPFVFAEGANFSAIPAAN
jgi:hypothetical protein